MHLDLANINTKKEEIDTNVLLNKIFSGKAILFTGAGFPLVQKILIIVSLLEQESYLNYCLRKWILHPLMRI